MPARVLLLSCLVAVLLPRAALAWADLGHQVIALVAEEYLEPAVRARVTQLLALDDATLVAGHDLASQATWADKYRESDRRSTRERYDGTNEWHFVDLDIHAPDLEAACHGFPPLPAGVPASRGPADDCIISKIGQFRAELRDPQTAEPERLRALQFLLHLIGDIHQPLHASNDQDRGGNDKPIVAPVPRRTDLHFYWDNYVVRQLGSDAEEIARLLLTRCTAAQRMLWSRGSPEDWAQESYQLGRDQVYARLPPPDSDGNRRLTATYVVPAEDRVMELLARAGVRLAMVLNEDLRQPPYQPP